MWFIASSLFTFQVCTTRFNNKNKFFGHFVCLVDHEGMGFLLLVGLGLQVLSVQRVELQSLPGCTVARALGTLRKQAKFCLKLISAEVQVLNY